MKEKFSPLTSFMALAFFMATIIGCGNDVDPDNNNNNNSEVSATDPNALMLFEANFEEGVIPYLGQENAHPGGGYFSWLGGTINGQDGDGTRDTDSYRNTILSSEPDAQGSVPNSNYSLKTHYAAGLQEVRGNGTEVGHNNSFLKNTTIIRLTEEQQEVYISWSQKWSATWQWPSDHQKLLKMLKKNPDGTVSVSFNFPMQSESADGMAPAVLMSTSVTEENKIWKTFAYRPPNGPVINSRDDDIVNNGFRSGNQDGNFIPEVDRWYQIKIHVRLNTPGSNDGLKEIWIDDKPYFRKEGMNFRRTLPEDGIDKFELQHVRETAAVTAVDMPTYMDNIKIWTVR